MRKLALVILFTLLASPVWATTYFLAPASGGGNDSNNGSSASAPWLTPNHPLNCGDVILAAASTAYAQANFTYGNWGTVTCAGGNNVAWLKCVTFDACKISITSTDGMDIDRNYWGIQGWEVDGSSNAGACFYAYPAAGVSIHHIVFANDIANICGQGGFGASPNGSAGVDYVAFVGDIAYNAVGGPAYCSSAFNVYEPVASDSLPGTHYYLAGLFAWNNVDGNPCSGGTPTDGEGLFFDTTDGSQTGLPAYTMQMVMDNSISVFNGGRGVQSLENKAGASQAPIYIRHITSYGNMTDTSQTRYQCGEIYLSASFRTQVFLSITEPTASKGCGDNPPYAYYVLNGDPTDLVYSNYGYSSSGNYSGTSGSGSFSFDPHNVFGTNPNFVNPVDPGAPNCSNSTSVPNCMATVIANFTPQAASAAGYGYQVPSTVQNYDPLFPQWLCNVNLLAGLVTMGCLSASSLPAPVTITNVTVQ